MVKRIELIMQSQGLTASQFADRIGIQRSGLSHILSGRNKPSLDFVLKVLKAFPELDPVWLLQGKGPMYANVTGFPAAHERSIGEEKVSGGRSQDSLEVPELPFEETGCVSTPEVSSILSGTDAHDVAPQPEDPDADGNPGRDIGEMPAFARKAPESRQPSSREGLNDMAFSRVSRKGMPPCRIVFFYEDGTFEVYSPR